MTIYTILLLFFCQLADLDSDHYAVRVNAQKQIVKEYEHEGQIDKLIADAKSAESRMALNYIRAEIKSKRIERAAYSCFRGVKPIGVDGLDEFLGVFGDSELSLKLFAELCNYDYKTIEGFINSDFKNGLAHEYSTEHRYSDQWKNKVILCFMVRVVNDKNLTEPPIILKAYSHYCEYCGDGGYQPAEPVPKQFVPLFER